MRFSKALALVGTQQVKELALATGSDEKSVERAIESRCAMALAA